MIAIRLWYESAVRKDLSVSEGVKLKMPEVWWSNVLKYKGYQLLIQSKLLDSCSHVRLMHEKTLLIQLNFSPKNNHADDFVRKNTFDPLLEKNTVFNFGSKVNWHASSSRDYISLLDRKLDPVYSSQLKMNYLRQCIWCKFSKVQWSDEYSEIE